MVILMKWLGMKWIISLNFVLFKLAKSSLYLVLFLYEKTPFWEQISFYFRNMMSVVAPNNSWKTTATNLKFHFKIFSLTIPGMRAPMGNRLPLKCPIYWEKKTINLHFSNYWQIIDVENFIKYGPINSCKVNRIRKRIVFEKKRRYMNKSVSNIWATIADLK